MRIISATVSNFGSYEGCEISLLDRGLTLVQGPTGSGKSTLCDVVPWALYGKTAKGGAVDDIRPWGVREPTVCSVLMNIKNTEVTVVRTRSSKNDLFYTVNGEVKRGKDVTDTQRLINQLIGIDYDTYLSAAYFHEFSRAASFFITTAKGRREICEQLVDLSLAKKLQTNLTDERKSLKSEADALERKIAIAISRAEDWAGQLAEAEELVAGWQTKQDSKIAALRHKVATTKPHVSHTSGNCPTCGSQTKGKTITNTLELDMAKRELKKQEEATNPYAVVLERGVAELNKAKNATLEMQSILTDLSNRLNNVELLLDIASTFRATLIKNTIVELQDRTNKYLSDYFDGEFTIELDISAEDKVELSIYKGEHNSVYTQLSKGQRQLLKLSFGAAVMQVVQNHSGVSINALFFDEALDGLDENLKKRAYNLLTKLSLDYEAILVVEHSQELKALFPNKITVSLQDGKSVFHE